MNCADMTKAQQDELLKDFSEGKTTICEAGHVDGLERTIDRLERMLFRLIQRVIGKKQEGILDKELQAFFKEMLKQDDYNTDEKTRLMMDDLLGTGDD